MSKLHDSIKVSAVEFWEFIFVLAFALFNFNLIAWGINLGEEITLFSGGKVLDYFIILTGVYLVSTYEKLKAKKTKNISTFKYVREQLVNYYPTILLGVLLVFVVRVSIGGVSLIRIPKLVVGSFMELLGLSQFGLVSYSIIPSTEALNLAISTGTINILWNEPLSYLTAMIIAGMILFYILNKNEDLFKTIVCPLTVLIGFSTIGMMEQYISVSPSIFNLSASIVRSFAGLALGSLLYYVVKYFKNKSYTKYNKMLLTLINFLFIVYFVWSFIYGNDWNDLINIIFIIPFMFINLLGEDYISRVLDSRFSVYLGQISLYVFASHMAFVYLVPYLFPNLSFVNMSIVYLIFCLVWGNIIYVFDTSVITPLFRTKK